MQGGTTTTTVPATNNKISAVGGTAYTYDAAGNITAIGANTYGWNAAGLLGTYNTAGGVYTYNAYNQRTKKVVASVTTQYVYGPNGLLIGEYSSTGTMQREYIYLNDAPLAQVTAGSPETVAYLHTDHLGTPRFATNSAGTSVWSWANDAFGVSTASGATTVNLRMPGQYYDSESGLFYNWNRYYNPAIGRYISSDPIGLADGLNPFAYVNINQVNGSDSWGLWDEPADLPNYNAGAVGTLVHEKFFEYIKNKFPQRNISTNTTLNGTFIGRPDVIEGNQLWELKPTSYRDDQLKYRQAQQQLCSYIEGTNIAGNNYGLGDPNQLVETGETFEFSYSNERIIVTLYADGNPNTGLIFYDLKEVKRQMQKARQPQGQTTPFLAPLPFSALNPILY